MTLRHSLACLGALCLFASNLPAQRYNLRKQPDQLDEFSVGTVFASPCDVKMSSLGNVYGYFNSAGKYNDLRIDDDSAKDTLNDGKTYNFSYLDVSQLCDINGNVSPYGGYIKGTAIKAVAEDGLFEKNGDSGITLGMDATYTHYFDKKHTFGIVVGISNNGFNSTQTAEWKANLWVRSDIYKYEGLNGVDGFTGNETRPHVFFPSEPEKYVYYDMVSSSVSELMGSDGKPLSQTVDGTWDLSAAYITLRLGGAYNLRLTRHFSLRLSGGFALVSASSRFRWDEKYSLLDSDGNFVLISMRDNDYENLELSGEDIKHKFLIGGWGDFGANYRINRKLTLFSSIGFQSTTSLHQETPAGHVIDLDSSNMYLAKTGFAWSF
jgi:hypothetical protein